MRASVIDATQDLTKDLAWVVDIGSAHHNDSGIPHGCSCKLLEPGGDLVGSWIYDDLVSLVLPKESLSAIQTSQTTFLTQHRRWEKIRPVLGNHNFREQPKRTIPNVPSQLLLVKGSLSSHGFTVLVLVKTGSTENEYRRIGLGRLETWNSLLEEDRVITIV